MSDRHRSGSRQGELFPRSKQPLVELEAGHPLVKIADELDWTELERLVQEVRRRKLKSRAGRPPHLRPMIGTVILMSWKRMTYRDAEDQVRHYAPARYLCGLTESKWTPDFTTIQDFHQLLGEDGIALINDSVLKLAVVKKLADPKLLVADTTAQEAAISYPNEIGLLASFMTAITLATNKAGGAFKRLAGWIGSKLKAVKQKIRHYRFFSETKKERAQLITETADIVDGVQRRLSRARKLPAGGVKRYGKVAQRKIGELHDTMTKLLPQIRYWVRTGFVARGKIVNVHIPQLYSIVRGKVGKPVEFGLNWGIARLGGGFLRATRAANHKELLDHAFVQRAVDDHIQLFGKPPRAFAYDRGGYSKANISKLAAKGVRQIGLAPRGQAEWQVTGRVKTKLISERAQVEGGIGALKCSRYGFNRPAARSVAMMGTCGQRSVLGFNLNKLVREMTKHAICAHGAA
jgi:IS5 family transposase